MSRKLLAAVLAAVAGFSATTATADVVTLRNGDKLTGTVTGIDGGKLILKTEGLGDAKIDTAQISTFSTDKPIDIHLTDGTVLPKQANASDPGTISLGGEGIVAGQKVQISQIAAINPPPVKWVGTFTLGGSLARGNTFTDTLNAAFALNLKLDKDQFFLNGEYNYGRQRVRTITGTGAGAVATLGPSNTTVDNWKLGEKYEHFFTQKFYGYLSADEAKDRIAFLDFRFVPSAGVGYQWFDGPKLTFSTEGGVAWVYESYTNATPTKEELSLKLAYHLMYKFNDHVSMFHNLTYTPSVEDVRNYLIDADIGLRANLTDHLFSEIKAQWNYNSAPADGALKNDQKFIASVGYTL